MGSWHSYPSVFNLGHRAVKDLLLDPVVVEEKIDGSQFSFGLIDGELKMKSKNAEVFPETAGMFSKAAEAIQDRRNLLRPNWTYRAEYLQKPKHNTLAYDRVPTGNLIIFDINTAEEEYLSPSEKAIEAEILKLECVPEFRVAVYSPGDVKSLLETISCLGGSKIEGVVIKNYCRFGLDKKVLMGKYVREAFKEKNQRTRAGENPAGRDIIEKLIIELRTPARWEKAVQHLRDAGKLIDSPKDIEALMVEVQTDTLKECEADIKAELMTWAWAKIRRKICAGLPGWYKAKLLDKQFEKGEE